MSDLDQKKFGSFNGVFIPNITMMFGVILFLRLGLVVSYVGPVAMTFMVLLAALIMLLTSLSITSIVTNMRVGAGGIYYLISRSLGLEIGGAIGLASYFSQIISIVMCASGFAYSLHEFLPSFPVQLTEFITVSILTLLTFTSADLALKTQLFIFGILTTSVLCIFLGNSESFLHREAATGYFASGLSFWAAFSIFFPAMTGIEAGMAMSGTLKKPSQDLTIGNFTSILLAASVYLGVALYIYQAIPISLLQSDPMILTEFGAFKSLIYLGIWGATLSSALGGMLGAPRMLQMMAQDGILFRFLSITHGPNKEPRYAILISYFLSVILLYCTSIDQIIPILTMICLIGYSILNLVACFCELINPPSWRPSMRAPWFLSAIGAFLCLFTMFMVDAGWTFISIFLVTTGYLLLRRKQMKGAFADIRKTLLFYFSRQLLYKLSESQQEAIHWRPQLLVFLPAPHRKQNLVLLSQELTRQNGILTFAAISTQPYMQQTLGGGFKNALKEYYKRARISCFVEVVDSPTLQEGVNNLIKCYGIGDLHPNTVIMGLPKREDTLQSLVPTFQTLQDIKKNLILFHDQSQEDAVIFKKPNKRNPKRIDIWWDPNYRESFELILSYLTTITDGIVWKKSIITLKTQVEEEQSRRNLLDYFETYFIQNRLPISADVYVIPHKDNMFPFDISSSSDADLLVLPLKPINEFSCHIAYAQYLSFIRNKLKKAPATCLVTRYDDIEHRDLYRFSNANES